MAADAFKDHIERGQRRADQLAASQVERQQQANRATLAKANERITAALSQQLKYSSTLSGNLDRALANVKANFATSQAVLRHTIELRHPLRDVTASYSVAYDASPVFEKYLARLQQSDSLQSGGLDISRDSQLWPQLSVDELPALLLLGSQTLRLDFYKRQPSIAGVIPRSDLTMYFRTYLTPSPNQFEPMQTVRYSTVDRRFIIGARHVLWQPVNLSGANIYSSTDLANSYCVVQLPQEWKVAVTGFGAVLNARRQAAIRLVDILTADGEDLVVYSMHPYVLKDGDVAYLGYCERRPSK